MIFALDAFFKQGGYGCAFVGCFPCELKITVCWCLCVFKSQRDFVVASALLRNFVMVANNISKREARVEGEA